MKNLLSGAHAFGLTPIVDFPPPQGSSGGRSRFRLDRARLATELQSARPFLRTGNRHFPENAQKLITHSIPPL
jgi:hypothetical protein